MKRFRFPLDSYLRLLRQQVEGVEARLANLRAQQRNCFAHADDLVAQRHGALADSTGQSVLDGAALASLDRWRSGLAQHAAHARQKAEALDGPIHDVTLEMKALKRRVELVERLRERRLAEHRRQEDREAEQIASELYLGNLHHRRV